MSLDIWLKVRKGDVQPLVPAGRIFIREGGGTKEISRQEWDERFPGREPVLVVPDAEDADDDMRQVWEGNITHNLNTMAQAAGLYQAMWHPEELHVVVAADLITPLAAGLERLKIDPEYFERMNPENGWGSYELLVEVVEKYLAACREWPHATVHVWG